MLCILWHASLKWCIFTWQASQVLINNRKSYFIPPFSYPLTVKSQDFVMHFFFFFSFSVCVSDTYGLIYVWYCGYTHFYKNTICNSIHKNVEKIGMTLCVSLKLKSKKKYTKNHAAVDHRRYKNDKNTLASYNNLVDAVSF